MKKQTYIYIQEPCHENWSSMTSEEQGRFCHSCSKTVTDFSLMSDTEILKYLSVAQGSTCGRFATDQVTRQIHQPATAAKKTFWAYLLSMFLPVMVAGKLNAQKKEEKPKTEQHLNSKPAKQLKEMKIMECAETSDTAKLSNSGTETNGEKLEGNFKTKAVMMGLIIEYDKVKKTDTISTIISKATKNEMFSIYPNPAIKGKKASIKMNATGEFTLQLLDLESKMIAYKTVHVNTKGQQVFLDIPAEIASGTYYLRLVQAGSNKQFVDKLVVK
jgi:hypothetical protein